MYALLPFLALAAAGAVHAANYCTTDVPIAPNTAWGCFTSPASNGIVALDEYYKQSAKIYYAKDKIHFAVVLTEPGTFALFESPKSDDVRIKQGEGNCIQYWKGGSSKSHTWCHDKDADHPIEM